MTTTITFNELRKIKDMLPSGSMQRIATDLGIDIETVRNYFGGDDYDEGKAAGSQAQAGFAVRPFIRRLSAGKIKPGLWIYKRKR